MGRASLILTTLAGAGAGAVITWGVMTHAGKPAPVPPPAHAGMVDPGDWLLEPGTTMEGIFQDGAMLLLEEPDQVTLHEPSDQPPGDAPDAIVHDGHAFQPVGKDAMVDPLLLRTARSISAYRAISMCEFKPAVLLRFTQGDRHLDLLFCFSCHDMLAFLDGKPCGGAGMSRDGDRSFAYHFQRLLPENAVLKAVVEARREAF
ncbi:MAG: hypothetical protein EOP88_11225 [Verrucomicrobiaceae bacterium]|nr:MAG: hypothetical protein EOP88_11225 [Verrucomicrobiaceae bacterium]